MIENRWYQEECCSSIIDFLDNKKGNPLVVLPTGSGKTVVIAKIVDKILTKNPNSNILILSHVKEILCQDKHSLENYFEGIEVGVWSSGLKEKSKRKIMVAGIQSIKNDFNKFMEYDIAIVDEAHLINHKVNGSYRKFLSKINAKVIGLTATPYRLGHGYIHKGKDRLFTDIVYDLSSMNNFNRLISEGYLCNLITKNTILEYDRKDISLISGDFSKKEMSVKFNREDITEKVLGEVAKWGKDRKKWLIFCIDIDHAENVKRVLTESHNILSETVHSKMSGDRSKILKDYEHGNIKCLVNVNVLTTGINIPTIDFIVILRPTKSHVLHVQMVGRGLRVAQDKNDCLVLDFAGNTKNLGAINDIMVEQKEDKKGNGVAPTKVCPQCGSIHSTKVKRCDIAGDLLIH